MRLNVGNGRCVIAMAAALALAGTHATLRAQTTLTATAGMPVRIELVGFCSVSAADLDFGAYASNAQTPVNGQTVIELRCSGGTVAELGLDAGSGPGGNTSRRRMEQDDGIDRLDYDLFQDPARTVHWGDKSGRDTLEVQATGAPQSVPVYGQIPARQRVRDGIYRDVITVRVLF